jgi:hypothetical protein
MFRSDHFADLSLNQWMALTPPELVQAHLNLDPQTMAVLRKDKPIIVSSSPDSRLNPGWRAQARGAVIVRRFRAAALTAGTDRYATTRNTPGVGPSLAAVRVARRGRRGREAERRACLCGSATVHAGISEPDVRWNDISVQVQQGETWR